MAKRVVEVFSAGCSACQETIELVNRIACPFCEVRILDMKEPKIAERAKQLGIVQVPSVVVNGTLAACCAGARPTEEGLREAGVGDPAP